MGGGGRNEVKGDCTKFSRFFFSFLKMQFIIRSFMILGGSVSYFPLCIFQATLSTSLGGSISPTNPTHSQPQRFSGSVPWSHQCVISLKMKKFTWFILSHLCSALCCASSFSQRYSLPQSSRLGVSHWHTGIILNVTPLFSCQFTNRTA